MAVTAEELTATLRVDPDDADEQSIVARILATGNALVEHYAGNAPTAIKDEAAIRIAGYLYDAPTASRTTMFAHVGRNSGAWGLLLPWRRPSALSTGEAADAGDTATTTGEDVAVIVLEATETEGRPFRVASGTAVVIVEDATQSGQVVIEARAPGSSAWVWLEGFRIDQANVIGPLSAIVDYRARADVAGPVVRVIGRGVTLQ